MTVYIHLSTTSIPLRTTKNVLRLPPYPSFSVPSSVRYAMVRGTRDKAQGDKDVKRPDTYRIAPLMGVRCVSCHAHQNHQNIECTVNNQPGLQYIPLTWLSTTVLAHICKSYRAIPASTAQRGSNRWLRLLTGALLCKYQYRGSCR